MRRVPAFSARLGAGLLAAVLVSSAAFAPASFAQDCGTGLGLYSPTDLQVRFESGAVAGNRLTWTGIPRADATCLSTRFEPASLQARLQPQIFGLYANEFDRALRFSMVTSGRVGSTTVDQLFLSVLNDHPNAAAGSRNGRINLSGRGGIFRVDPSGSGTAAQVNQGLPGHIDNVEITAMTRHEQSGRIFASIRSLPLVVSDDGGETWREPATPVRPPFRSAIRSIAVSPENVDLVFMSVERQGLWRSSDGGATWARTPAIDLLVSATEVDVSVARYLRVVPTGGDPSDPNDRVSRLYVHVAGSGLYFSDDDGETFTRILGLRRPRLELLPTGDRAINCAVQEDLTLQNAAVRDIEISPTQPEKIYLGVRDWGVYVGDTSTGHTDWEWRSDGLVLCQGSPDRPLGERREVRQLVVLPSVDRTEDILIVATDTPSAPSDIGSDERSNTNVLLSQDSGRTWSLAPLRDVIDPDVGEVPLSVTALVADPRASRPQGVIAATATRGLWEFNVEAQAGSWVQLAQQPYTLRTTELWPLRNGTLLVGTSGAGVYRPGLVVDLDRLFALNLAEGIDPGIGLRVSLNGTDPLVSGETFTVVGQTFQAYAVWRARELDLQTGEPRWEMIGLYDLTNPEFCSPNSCDEPDLVPIQGCFADKRANCFDAPEGSGSDAQWSFFDRDVYNGFTYYYAVTTLDYGNTASVSPTNFNGDFRFSPRSSVESDPAALPYVDLNGGQNYNLQLFQVNVRTAADLKNVFAVPNPLVRQAGWDVGEASSIRFVNVTATSKVQIFTLAGDLVQELDNVVFADEERGNIEWDTRNAEGELVASGVYIYRVTDDDGNEVVDRFTVIR